MIKCRGLNTVVRSAAKSTITGPDARHDANAEYPLAGLRPRDWPRDQLDEDDEKASKDRPMNNYN